MKCFLLFFLEVVSKNKNGLSIKKRTIGDINDTDLMRKVKKYNQIKQLTSRIEFKIMILAL